MSRFGRFQELAFVDNAETARLGVDTTHPLTQNDVGKLVKHGVSQNFILCAAGDDIDGWLNTVEPGTVDGGYAFGGVLREGRITVQIGTSTVAVNDYVVADTQAAVGTAGYGKVKTGSPAHAFWKVIALMTSPTALTADGNGTAGQYALIERI